MTARPRRRRTRGPTAATVAEEAAPSAANGAAKASPVARRIAAAEGVDLAGVAGSGAGGRVMKADVIAAQQDGAAPRRTRPTRR